MKTPYRPWAHGGVRGRGTGLGLATVLDLVMPGLSGKDTYLALRALAPGVGVLLMSGYTINEEVEAILELGVRSFLSKPYSMEALARELELLTA